MITKTEFQDLIANAYQHLYDFVYLRNHPLTQMLVTDDSINHKERGWQIHHTLLEVVEELYPGSTAPPFSREWRRHRLMVLRYVEVMEPQMVADQLAISRRQYYREHAAAIEAVADILWERRIHEAPDTTGDAHQPPLDQNEAMQLEVARISQNDAYADLLDVIEGVLAVLKNVLYENDITIDTDLPAEMPLTSIGHSLLRQVMLGVLGYFAENVTQAAVTLAAVPDDLSIHVLVTVASPHSLDPVQANARLATFQEMLQLGNANITLITDDQHPPVGFDLELPIEYDCTVLAIDDNEDTLAFYKRCLTPNRYRVIITPTAGSALSLARESLPDIIILDLMMPHQDGWDLLQLLSTQPDTAHIPIMICSVLKQKQLALSLGAAAFLEKPFTEQTLLSVLGELRKKD